MNIHNLVTANGPCGTDIITPSDSADLPRLYRALRIDVGGTLKVIFIQGDGSRSAATTRNVVAGELYYEGPVVRIYATGTDATGIGGIV